MFPHTVTIYRHAVENDADVYTRQIVGGVYWNSTDGETLSGRGTVQDKGCTVITSPETTAGFGTKWTVQAGDRIVPGECPEIGRLSDVVGGYTVRQIAVNVCGSPLDNLVITGE